ncbi:hypothetical protein CS0771_70140 [Catellatospora sp. IY07-71]|uniref:hypothetical protein n=1 Tax=Catellatospora sp. IY07-71 TaxID=2728827 RepID=UPI001BB3948C|nr:hypothetical protein [Catellatospora sp. IY07-71]BCJ77470.1 hypothetical protein CS0771_70140 [Catellatospora sp. IY07-71]
MLLAAVFPSGFSPSAEQLAAAVSGVLLAVPILFTLTAGLPVVARPEPETEPVAW